MYHSKYAGTGVIRKSPRNNIQSRSAFTLIELLVVIAIIGVLLALTTSAVQRVRHAAARTKCANQLRQIGVAIHNYHDARGRLPEGQIGPYAPPGVKTKYGWGKDSHGWSWIAKLLPYLEEDGVHRTGGIPRKTLAQSGVADQRIRVLLCPADGSATGAARSNTGNLKDFPVGQTSYKAVTGSNWGYDSGEDRWLQTFWVNKSARGSYDGLIEGDGIMDRADIFHPKRFVDVRDGLGATLMIGEDVVSKNLWLSWPYASHTYGTCAIPLNATVPNGMEIHPFDWHNNYGFRSAHISGGQFALADGSVRFLRDSIAETTYRALGTIAGRESVTLDD
jgi:prepilin-type N-terminal cleavage/methylation domain-containing protein